MKKIMLVFGVLLFLLLNTTATKIISLTANPETDIVKAMNEVTPFLTLNNDYSIKFNVSKAMDSGLSEQTIEVGIDYEKFHNSTISSIKQFGIISGKIDKKSFSKYEKFFQYVAQTNSISSSNSSGNPIQQLVCGGDMQNPHTCPSRINSGVYRSSLNGIRNYLISIGFHNTYWPGCGSQGYNCSTDFTRWVNAYNCSYWGAFRTQANIFQNGSLWSYRTQSPEPNPEIFSYNWPVSWWGTYVTWWHIYSCN